MIFAFSIAPAPRHEEAIKQRAQTKWGERIGAVFLVIGALIIDAAWAIRGDCSITPLRKASTPKPKSMEEQA